MAYELTGTIVKIYPTKKVSENFRTREFVVETVEEVGDKQYQQYIKLQVTQDRCDGLDKIAEGEVINVHFNLRGRAWEKGGEVNYFNSLVAWKIVPVESNTTPDPIPTQAEATDDLPF